MERPKFPWSKKPDETKQLERMWNVKPSIPAIHSEMAQAAVYYDEQIKEWEDAIAELPAETRALINIGVDLIKANEEIYHDSTWTHTLRGSISDNKILRFLAA